MLPTPSDPLDRVCQQLDEFAHRLPGGEAQEVAYGKR